MATTVAVGVGVALSRAARERARPGPRRGGERQFALLPEERLADGVVRMALGQADLAIELMGGGGGTLDERAVHGTRKAIKRLRALLRLLRHELGPKAYARENAALRRTAGHLAGARDAEVMLATLDALIARHPRRLRESAGVSRLRAQLSAEHEQMEQRTLGDHATQAEVLRELRAFRARVLDWKLSDRDGSRLLEPGIARVYRQGQGRYRRAAHGRGDRAKAMHDWRKRVKDLRYAAELLQRRDPGQPGGVGGRTRGDSARGGEDGKLRRLAEQADELGEMLGEEHDLALLAERVRADSRSGAGRKRAKRPAGGPRPMGRRSRRLLLARIERRRRQLRKRALREGERIYGRSPKRFQRRVRSAYASELRRSL